MNVIEIIHIERADMHCQGIMDQQQVLNQQQIQPIQPAIQGNNDAADLARQIQANTNVTMKTEVVKLPDFFGDPAKDTVTALEFMARIDECQITNEWNDITTCHPSSGFDGEWDRYMYLSEDGRESLCMYGGYRMTVNATMTMPTKTHTAKTK